MFTIPNLAETTVADAAGPDSRDFDIFASSYAMSGVEMEDGLGAGAVTLSSGLVLNVAQANARVRGKRVFITAGTVTLGAAHATLPRWDLIASDAFGTRTVIAGTAAAIPVFPTFDPVTRTILAAAYVPALATTPSVIVDKRVHMWRPPMENIEWYGASTGATAAANTAAVHAAMAAGRGFVPAKTYVVAKVTMPHAGVLEGVNSGTYNNTFAAGLVSILQLGAGQNTDVIEVPITSNRGRIKDLQLDGNKGNQTTGTGNGLHFLADTVQNEAQWEVHQVYSHDCRGTGIVVNGWRQAVELYRCIANFNQGHGIQIIGTDCVLAFPICGDNLAGAGIVVSGNVTTVYGGAIYNNQRGIEITPGTKRVDVIATSMDKNLRPGCIIAATCDAITLLACKFTSNGRETNNTYPHIDLLTTTGGVTVVGCQFSGLEPGVTNAATWGIAQAANAAFYDAGNICPAAASVQGFSSLPELVYTSTRPTFQGSLSLFHSDLIGAVSQATQGLNLPVALTEWDITFAGTRRTIETEDMGREFQLGVRIRSATYTAPANTLIFTVRDTSNTANILCTVTIVVGGVSLNFEGISVWAAKPSWLTGTKTLGLYTSGGDAVDDIIMRDATLRWRG